jgi:hypothetical protein
VPLIDTTMAHGEAAVETELTEETMLPAIAMWTTRKNGAVEHAHAVRPALLRSFRGRLMLAVGATEGRWECSICTATSCRGSMTEPRR